MTRKELLLFAISACLATPFAWADPARDMSAPSERDLVVYYACEAAAARAFLDAETARTCSRTFTRIKMSLVPAILGAGQESVGIQEWADAHRAGYLAFRDWTVANPERVARARAKAMDLVPSEGFRIGGVWAR
ncbi:hypothetical protein P1J78_23440 [Psychromarinibacter sp. C21-152]|uniref:Uncharacterized protein n=1 Tax=Psychromarinibacter sediminicola TaxID=3033385 RepID=A0AAE3TBC0_9RHOB|nr:hypothetical protein [Psychromarinibacter sediminicola]MDF0603683.1 hypothetical protein [Psychromarinibacter sediminicola]